MNILFAETLKKLLTNNGFSKRELVERMYVTRSTITWREGGCRSPDAAMIFRLAHSLGTNFNTLISAALKSKDAPNVIIADDRKMFL